MPRQISLNPFAKPVAFTAAELDQIRRVAEARQAPKDRNLDRVTDKRIMHRNNVETHVIGLLGECAVARLLGCAIDAGAYLAGDVTQDFALYGVTIEVKTLQGFLAFRAMEDFVADVAVLAIYDKADYGRLTVQGWVARKDFEREHFVDDFGYGPRPCMQPSQLHSMETLRTYCLLVRNQRYLLERVQGAESLKNGEVSN